MSLRADAVAAFRALERRPALLVVGAAVGFLQAGAWVAAAILSRDIAPDVWWVVGPVAAGIAVLFALPAYAAIYVPVTGPPAGVRETLGAAWSAVADRYRSLLAADLLAAAVSVSVAVLAGLVWLVASTGVRYARYALADPGPPHPMESVYLGTAALTLGLALGGLCVRFADLFVAFGDESPRTAWRSSLAFARRRPASLSGFGVLVAALHATPGVGGRFTAWVLGDAPAGVLLGIVVAATLGSVGVALSGALGATYFRRTVAPAVEAPAAAGGDGVRWSRVAVAALVLGVAVGGAVAVRAADVRPVDRETAALPDEPDAAYAVAASNTRDLGYRRVVVGWNLSDPDPDGSIVRRSGVDYRDRRAYVYFSDLGTDREVGGYFAEGTIAIRRTAVSSSGRLARRAGNWTVLVAPGYGVAAPDETVGSAIPGGDVNWTVAARNGSTLVVRVEDPAAVREALSPETYAGMGPNMTDDSYLAVTVDRDRSVVRRAEFRLRSAETGDDYRYVVRFEDVGTADLRRPRALGPRRPAEWAWDVLYY